MHKEFGRIDVLVNCAGTAGLASESILKVTSAQFRDLIDAHLGTVFETCRAAAPKMVAQGGGSIINTSSFAFLGDYGGTGYPAGKGGVNGLTLAIAAELKEHGVRANVVCPGAKTRLSTGPEYEGHIVELNRRGLLDEVSMQAALDAPPPEYVAPTYAYLAGDLAKDVTGQIFIAAGGFVGRFDRQSPSSSAIATTTTHRRGLSTKSGDGHAKSPVKLRDCAQIEKSAARRIAISPQFRRRYALKTRLSATNRTSVATRLAATSTDSSTPLPTAGSKRCSTNSEPLVTAKPNMNTSRPDNWWRATPVRPGYRT